jgi:hypothetical protein
MDRPTIPALTVLSTLVLAAAPAPARACDPMPPHLADAVPEAGAADVPRGTALLVRVPLLSPLAAVEVGLTVDGAPYTPRIERVDYGPAVDLQVFREGALIALWLPEGAPNGLATFTFPDVISEATWETATHTLRTVDGPVPPLAGTPTSTGALGPDEPRDYGTCGVEQGRLLTVDLEASDAVAAVLWVEEGEGEVPVTAAFFAPGSASLRLTGLVEGDRTEACWVVEAWGRAGDRVRSDRSCAPVTDGADGADDGEDKGGCDALGGGIAGVWALGAASAALWRRRGGAQAPGHRREPRGR